MSKTVEILGMARNDYAFGRKGALRALIGFGFAYHLASEEGTTPAKTCLDDIGTILRAEGAVKSEVSTKRKIAKQVGERFKALFAAELATAYASDADRVQAMFLAAQASGATTVQRLYDWAKHGDANHTDTVKEKAAQEKAETQARNAAARLEAIEDASQGQPMGFDAVPEAVEVQKLNPTAEAQAPDLAAIVADLIAAHGFDAVKDAVLAAGVEVVADAAAA